MATSSSKGDVDARPRVVQTTKSFSRYEPSNFPLSPTRSRASTIQTPQSTIADVYPHAEQDGKRNASDVFEKQISTEESDGSPHIDRSQIPQEIPDELPIELESLTDRYVCLNIL